MFRGDTGWEVEEEDVRELPILCGMVREIQTADG